MIVIDTSVIYALLDRDDRRHQEAAGWYRRARPAVATAIAERYADLGLGLTDASLVVLAARLGTTSIATFDERHFRAVQPLRGGKAFTLVPLDVPG